MASDFTRGIKVYLDSQGYGQGIKEMQETTAKYRKELQLLEQQGKGNGKEADRLRRKIEANVKTEAQYNQSLAETQRVLNNLSGASYKELVAARNKVKAQLKTMTRGTREYNDLLRVLQRTETEVAAATNAMNAANMAGQGVFTKLAGFLHKYLVILTGVGAGLAGTIAAGRKAVSAYAELEEAMASVGKYAGMTSEECKALNAALATINTRTSQLELNRLAAEAGKLGIKGVQNIRDFVEAADMINLSLGENMGEDAVKNIGKLAMMFGEDEKKGLSGAMLSTASAAYKLATSSTASEPYLVEFAARLGGIGNQARITQADIMGIASVLDQNMQQVEMSSTAVSTLITKMFRDTSTFAQTAGMDVKEFTDLLEKDANEALLKVLEALNAKGGFKDLVPIFDDMKMDGRRAVGVLSALATKVNDVREAQEIANQAYNDGTAAVEAFDRMNNTVQASMEKARKRLQAIRVELGEQLRPIMSKIFTTSSLTVRGLATLVTALIKYRATVITATVALTAYNLWVRRSIIADKLKVFWTDTLVASMKKLWATILANPWAALAAGVAMAAAAISDMVKRSKELTAAQKTMKRIEDQVSDSTADEYARVTALNKILHDNKQSLSQRQQALEALKQVIPGYNAMLSDEGAITRDNTRAIDEYLKRLEQEAKFKAVKDELTEQYAAQRKAVKELAEAEAEEKRLQDQRAQGTRTVVGTSITGYTMSTGDSVDQLLMQTQTIVKARKKALNEIGDTITALEKEIQDSDVVALFAGEVPEPTTTTSTAKGDSGKTAADRVREQFEAMYEAAEEGHDAITDNLKAELAKRNITQAQYDVASSAENQRYYAERLQIDADYYEAVGRTTYDKEEQRANDLKAIHKATIKDERALQDARLKDLETYYKSMDAMTKMAEKDEQDPVKRLQMEKDAELAVLDGYYQASLDYARAHGMDEAVIEEAYQQALAAIDAKYADKRTDIAEKEEDKKRHARQKFGMQTIRQQYEEDLALLEQYHNQALLSDKEYYRAKSMLGAQYWTDMARMYADYFADTITTLQDAEIAVSEAKYDVLISQAEAAGKETADIETAKANATLDIQKRYADVNFAAKASQIIADTAVAIMQGYADLGPIAGSVAAAMLAVTGVAQLATANAERRKVKQLSLQQGAGSGAGTSMQRVVQHANGQYDVLGGQDGRRYSAPYIGAAQTGIVTRPALVGERGSELIVNADDLSRLRQHINYPVVAAAINDARRGMVTQHAAGNYGALPANGANGADTLATLQRIAALVEQLPNNHRCYIVLSDLDNARDLQRRAQSPFVRGDNR